jgi:regulator of replication initiation timing
MSQNLSGALQQLVKANCKIAELLTENNNLKEQIKVQNILSTADVNINVEKAEKEKPENAGKTVKFDPKTRRVYVNDAVVDSFRPHLF